MKTSRLIMILVLLLSISLVYYGCNKTIHTDIKKETALEPMFVPVLQKWMNVQRNAAQYYEQLGMDSLLYLSEWHQGVFTRVSASKSVIYVPLKNSPLGLAFFYDTKSNSVDSGNIVSVKSTSTSRNKQPISAIVTYYQTILLQQKSDERFSGILTSYSIKNRYQYDYGFKEGSIVWRGYIAPKPNISDKFKSTGVKVNAMVCEWWGHFTRWTDGSLSLDYVYQVCEDDCQTTSINIKSGHQYIKVNCGGGGGTTTETPYEVWNLVVNPCLRKIITQLLSSPDRVVIPYARVTYTDVLTENFYNVFGGRDYFFNRNIVFAESTTIPYEGRYVSQSTQYQTIPDTIYLNPEKIGGDASQEFISSIIVHEMAHAVLNYTGQLFYLSDHFQMANNYVDVISQTLRNIYPDLSLAAARSLGIQGLGANVYNSPFFPSLITSYGFTTNNSDTSFWSYLSQRLAAGTDGKKQCQ